MNRVWFSQKKRIYGQGLLARQIALMCLTTCAFLPSCSQGFRAARIEGSPQKSTKLGASAGATVREPDSRNTEASSSTIVTINPAAVAGTTPNYAPNTSLNYETHTNEILNPERGFHETASLTNTAGWQRFENFPAIRKSGMSLFRGHVRMDEFRTWGDLPWSLLNDLEISFNGLRAAGIKSTVVFSYNFSMTPPDNGDAPLGLVLRHLEQLKPVLQKHQDVIAALETGFVGAWGEWHSSTNQLTTPENKLAVLNAILDALPLSRTMQLRYPLDVMRAYPTPLDETSAHKDSHQARTGLANLCFLVDESNGGTWSSDNGVSAAERRAYMQQSSRFVMMGGETCEIQSLNDQPSHCSQALSELQQFHYTYLNSSYAKPVIDRWKAEGCYAEISRRLGYRLRLTRLEYPKETKPGSSAQIKMTLKNDGFAAPSNKRSFIIVLRNSASGQTTQFDFSAVQDPRKWEPEKGDIGLTIALPLPATLAAGTYQVFLKLSDPMPELAMRPEYSIRLANTRAGVDVWDAASGMNNLGAEIRVVR
jgi:hypothetical protein